MRSFLLAATCAALVTGSMMDAPARAEELLSPEQARAFVVGREFAFTCFEGSKGSGRIFSDGSVAGILVLREKPARFVRLPPNTVRVQGEAVCGHLKGMVFDPCFDVVKTGAFTFRGKLAGVEGMWCEFQRVDRDRAQIASRRGRGRGAREASAE